MKSWSCYLQGCLCNLSCPCSGLYLLIWTLFPSWLSSSITFSHFPVINTDGSGASTCNSLICQVLTDKITSSPIHLIIYSFQLILFAVVKYHLLEILLKSWFCRHCISCGSCTPIGSDAD
ncbi:hypothetical protein O6P43_029046 [Quillaja saponaria]|uniref:Uncharacterized protein n=1 Tax=Quillaja saponaria TaxID=32244 RepID=A0AAD7KZ54_QUISA|nr:hypothetical protein O6P43_029046 [Quillaja saponaria]